MTTRILGIDPGSRSTGVAVLEVSGASTAVLQHDHLRPPQRLDFSGKILFIADGIGDLIEGFSPSEAAVEDLFMATNARSGLQLAHLRGAILLELARREVALFTYAPKAVKKAVTGVGGATKEQVRYMVQKLLGVSLEGKADDVSDALAVALCHAHSRGSGGR